MQRFTGPVPVESMVMIARNARGEPCEPNSEAKAGPFTCFGCGELLVIRRAHFRSRPSSSATNVFAVREHFLHISNGQECTNNETWIHAAAKHMLASNPLHPMQLHCSACGHKCTFRITDVEDEVRGVTEYRLPNGRIVDVAILHNDSCVAVIEVCHSHPCDDAKLLDLADTVQNSWCEVTATAVIRCMQKKDEQQVLDLHGRTLQEAAQTADLRRASEELETAREERIKQEAALSLLQKRKRISDIGGETMLNFGKYKGLALEAVFEEDVSYVLWLAWRSTEFDSLTVKAARKLVKGLCRNCGEEVDGPEWKTLCLECYREVRSR